MPTFNRYCYDPLVEEDTVRYVVLDPAPDPKTPLSCKILQTRLSALGAGYCAISYVWGKPEFPYNLEIQEECDTSYLRITASVDSLLRAFRSLNEPRRLWIDALCIDQDNETEKGHQIPLMGKIYEQAAEVRIWLGPEDYATQGIFKFFARLGQVPPLTQSEMGTIKQSDMSERVVDLLNKYVKNRPGFDEATSPFKGPGILCLNDFFARPWFFRRWVVQEACLASQAFVYCGQRSIPLSDIVSAAKHIQVLDISWYTVRMTANLRKPSVDSGILELLWTFHEGACFEKKDRIAALFGLLDKAQRFPLDYSVHWTELYKQVAEFVLTQDDPRLKFQLLLHLFEFGPVSGEDDGSYPSWVPDWSQVRQRRLPYYFRVRTPDTHEPYPKSPKRPAQATLRLENSSLRIYWDPSVGGWEGRRVIYAAHLDENLQDEEHNAKRALQVLRDLFPSIQSYGEQVLIPASSRHILALAAFVKMIVKHRHPHFNQELNDGPFEMFLETVGEEMPAASDIETLFYLTKLQLLLQEYSLYELERLTSEPDNVRTFGFSTELIRVDDVMIPLWQPERLYTNDFRGKRSQLRTMLAIRRQESPEYKTRQSGYGVPSQKGRIVGPAMSISSGGDYYDGPDRNSSIVSLFRSFLPVPKVLRKLMGQGDAGLWDSDRDFNDKASLDLC